MEGLLSKLASAFDSAPRAFALALLLGAVIYLPFLGSRPLWDADEPRVAGIAASMASEGDWTTPRLNGTPFLELPPLYWWTSAGVLKALGDSTATAKLPSALSALACVMMAFAMARAFGLSNLASFVCSMILATAPEFWIIGRRCIMDMLLCACVCLSFLSFAKFRLGEGRGCWLWLALFWLGLSGAVMTKGVVGLGIPCAGLFFWLVVSRERSLAVWAGLFGAALLSLLPVSIWLLALLRAEGFDAVKTVVWTNNLGRFTGGHAEHVEPFHYYFVKFPAQFLPWTVLAAGSAFLLFKGLLGEGARKAAIFGGLAVAVPFGILCVAAGKRSIYLLPLYPVAALFAAASAEWLFTRFSSRERLIKALAAAAFAIYAVCLLVADAVIMPLSSPESSIEPLFKSCAKMIADGRKLALYRPIERISGGAVFYLSRRVDVCMSEDELAAVFEKDPKAFFVAGEASIKDFKKPVSVLERFDTGRRDCYVIFSFAVKTEAP